MRDGFMGRGMGEEAGSACFAPTLAQVQMGVVPNLWHPSNGWDILATELQDPAPHDHRRHSRHHLFIPHFSDACKTVRFMPWITQCLWSDFKKHTKVCEVTKITCVLDLGLSLSNQHINLHAWHCHLLSHAQTYVITRDVQLNPHGLALEKHFFLLVSHTHTRGSSRWSCFNH